MQNQAKESGYSSEGRRCGIERRTFAYTCHIPERRTGVDRRCGNDRRMSPRLKLEPAPQHA